MRPHLVLLAALTAASITLTSCGTDADASSAPSSAAFNQADADFIPAMNQLISQSTTLAETAATRSEDPAVRRLAASMKQAQYPQLDQLVRLNQQAARQPGLHFTHDHGDSAASIPGMLPEADVDRMTAAPGQRFDRMFLTLAARHHDGALKLVHTEQAHGRSTATKHLATQIGTTLDQENAQIRQLLHR